MALVGMSIVEQRYQAVLAVLAGDPVTEVAEKIGVSRQSLHTWLRRYADEGLAGLQDRSHRPDGCAHQAAPRWRRWSVSCAGTIRSGDRGGSRSSWAGTAVPARCRHG